jgi:glyoxylase-like metal-dependent hydrolase (beta-lactamase superfamily II)
MRTTAVPSLYASPPHPLPFAPELDIRAFVLPRAAGNLLVYSAPAITVDPDGIQELGGVVRHYLNHWHEAMFLSDDVAAPVHVHEADRDEVAERTTVAATFAARETIGHDFEVIPIPGHTPGATAFLWDSGERRHLFTGDSIYLHEGEWIAAVLESSDRAAYLRSLELLREVEFDVLVPWAATSGEPHFTTTSRADARRRIDAIIERLRRGENF